jgi:hypothetical protein
VIAGDGPSPSFVVSLARRLPDTSMTSALASGGRHHFGWGTDRHMMADIYDALNQNTRATGQWDKKPPEIPPWPRPEAGDLTPEEKKPVTVADLYKRFAGKGVPTL